MTNYIIKKSINKKILSINSSEKIAELINLTLSRKERCRIALSGGSTPSDTYCLLREFNLPWHRVDVFLGDERWVDPDDSSSNSLMLRNTLLLNGPASKANFLSVPTTELSSPEDSSKALTELLKKTFKSDNPIFDLILLGLGDDGHTASLFPGTNSLFESEKLITVSEGKGMPRITFTSKLLCAAVNVIFLVSGASKQIPLKRLIDNNESVERTPAKLVQPTNGNVYILADELAANLI